MQCMHPHPVPTMMQKPPQALQLLSPRHARIRVSGALVAALPRARWWCRQG